ncbi:helix-turn-helix transcriptional regulator [Chitinophaga horti]|uniref:Helix-turn-helix transcriptional regulator n=1 Tax=Chitinophaga horti TaxID=2920382 RepID=A0ABY6J701_9BACT|nr:helix-turn-helix transcriptional regulator [Chitinophaga horti]UYQ95413.1 helix-turn-helix transcriptional regulator [Chitinophaga horti]
MKLPKKYISRQQEITEAYIAAVNAHIDDIVAGRVNDMMHVKDIAAQLFIHPVHLSNTIRLFTGNSACHYMEVRVMDEARRMLADPSRTIADVARQLTFDTSNFTKFFKSQEGITPSQFRKTLV